MTPVEFLPALCSHVDAPLRVVPTPPEAPLWPSEIVTLGVLQALKGVGNRAGYRWVTRAYRALGPCVPERTRLLRLCVTPQDWTQVFWVSPTGLGGSATDGIELSHPRRAGRSPHQIGRTGLSPHRWSVGGTRGLLRNQYGVVVAGACDTAHGAEPTLQWRMRPCEARLMVLRDPAFHAAEGEPANRTLCQRGAWQDRLLVETGRSMRTVVCHCKRGMYRGWPYFQARLAFTMAACHVLVQWHGFQPSALGFVPLSMAGFSCKRLTPLV